MYPRRVNTGMSQISIGGYLQKMSKTPFTFKSSSIDSKKINEIGSLDSQKPVQFNGGTQKNGNGESQKNPSQKSSSILNSFKQASQSTAKKVSPSAILNRLEENEREREREKENEDDDGIPKWAQPQYMRDAEHRKPDDPKYDPTTLYVVRIPCFHF